jgi:hypothetical protein
MQLPCRVAAPHRDAKQVVLSGADWLCFAFTALPRVILFADLFYNMSDPGQEAYNA